MGHQVVFEVEGPMAMFARPDTGSTPVSYPVPTYPTARGMFDAVARLRSAFIRPTRVEICRPIRFHRYVTNYGGPLRKSVQKAKDSNYQLYATVLVDVCYRVYGEVHGKRSTRGEGDSRLRPRHGRHDDCLKLKEMFDLRLQSGTPHYTPCLGWREFVPTYFGPFRPETKVVCHNEVIPRLLSSMWEHHELKPEFRQDWEIVNGVMSYDHRRPTDAE